MMQKIQKFGGAMFTPVLLFAFAGTVVGLGTLFTTEVIFGSLAAKDSLWYQCWNVILQGGWTVFNQLPLLFAVSLPIGLASKQNARCCMEALVGYLTFQYFVNTMLTQWGGVFGVDMSLDPGAASGLALIASIKTLDMGMIGALCISGIIIAIHNRFFDVELPEWLGVFNGSVFVYVVCFFVLLPTALLTCVIWPHVQDGISALQGFLLSTGYVGVWVFVFLERILIPFGLHHLLYSPLFYDNIVVHGGIYSAWANELPKIAASTDSLAQIAPWARFTSTGWSKVFGCLGIALAFYNTAKPERRAELLGLLIPITLTAALCGITEPIEFTFLFMAPVLFVVHAILAACLSTCMYLAGVVGVFSGGLIEMSSMDFIPLMASHGMTYLLALIIGLVFTGIWFIVFRTLILRFDFKTPGREDVDEYIEFKSKRDYLESKGGTVQGEGPSKRAILAANVMDLLGGPDNIVDVTNCATRLRVNVRDEALIGEDKDFKQVGAMGISKKGKSAQVIIGLSVPYVREEFERLLGEQED